MSVLVLLCWLILSDKSQSQGVGEDKDVTGRPWENPLQELQHVTPACALKIPNFPDIASQEQTKWQQCIDKITLPIFNKYPVLESRSNVQEDEKINSSVIHEIDKQLHLIICRNTSVFKSCWNGIINALNKCSFGNGDVSGKLYFALYDDTCRDGGRSTVERRRKAVLEGRLCYRNYSTDECNVNRENIYPTDLCSRFRSNVACDLSSIDPNCENKIDKGINMEIFQRVEKVLGCTSASSPVMDNAHSSSVTVIDCKLSSLIKFIVFLFTLWS